MNNIESKIEERNLDKPDADVNASDDRCQRNFLWYAINDFSSILGTFLKP